MKSILSLEQLTNLGLDESFAQDLHKQIEMHVNNNTPEEAWRILSAKLYTLDVSFEIHLLLFSTLFPRWRSDPETAPSWIPSQTVKEKANLSKLMSDLKMHDVKTFHHWSFTSYQEFWQHMLSLLKINFKKSPTAICDLSNGIESPKWLPQAMMNITDSCFTATPSATALILEDDKKAISNISYFELNQLSNRIANSLVQQGFVPGDAIGIAMPMNLYAVAIYLGILKMGGVVVSIADSFSPDEMATRINITKAKALFTQDVALWGGKKIPLYEKVKKIHPLITQVHSTPFKIFIVPFQSKVTGTLSKEDSAWQDFLVSNDQFTSVSCDPMAPCNILFSSGTTGTPKAIVWNHTTPLKAASDAFLHHNIKIGDVLAWPTNLGWMMGPWLIFAALINRGTIALYSEAPKDRGFGEFIQNAKVNMLGVVPTLVASWRHSKCMEKLDWSAIKVFSSTGECSNPEDMFYLMWLAGYKPIIEYCGGTEIGGAYISSTVIENNYPSLFTTPTFGLNIEIINEEGKPSSLGEVAIVPPSIGLSTALLNADHHQVYYENMPKTPDGKILRRHGDQIKLFPHGLYCVLGRVDDTMNLGGIKISAAEIERILMGLPHIMEVAAIAIPPRDRGPSLLIIFASSAMKEKKEILMDLMQKRINTLLNPLFKIHDVIIMEELPKTATNKIMRRVLRQKYIEIADH